MRHPLGRLAAILGLLSALLAVPVTSVMACSCAFVGYPEAIAGADAAFIGTVVEAHEPERGAIGGGFLEVSYVLEVERAAKPMTAPARVHAHLGDGANCGIDMDVGQRWLVLAHLEDGELRTNSCSPSLPWTDDVDPETAALVDGLLTVTPERATSTEGGVADIPLPLLLAGLGALVVGLVSAVAFRRAG